MIAVTQELEVGNIIVFDNGNNFGHPYVGRVVETDSSRTLIDMSEEFHAYERWFNTKEIRLWNWDEIEEWESRQWDNFPM